MKLRFDLSQRHVLVPVKVIGPMGANHLPMVVDTGSTHTVINRKSLHATGIVINPNGPFCSMATGSGVATAPVVTVSEIGIPGLSQTNFRVVAHQFPNEIKINGILGLDFFRGTKLTLDFREGILEID